MYILNENHSQMAFWMLDGMNEWLKSIIHISSKWMHVNPLRISVSIVENRVKCIIIRYLVYLLWITIIYLLFILEMVLQRIRFLYVLMHLVNSTDHFTSLSFNRNEHIFVQSIKMYVIQRNSLMHSGYR